MRNLLLIISMLALFACNQQTKSTEKDIDGTTKAEQETSTPLEYNEFIVSRQMKVLDYMQQFVNASSVSPDSGLAVLPEFEMKTAVLVKELEAMPDYKGDTTLRSAAVDLFRFYRQTLGVEYVQMMKLRKSDDENSVEKMNAIVTDLSERETRYDRNFMTAQQAFARRYNMRLQENSRQDEVDRMGQ